MVVHALLSRGQPWCVAYHLLRHKQCHMMVRKRGADICFCLSISVMANPGELTGSADCFIGTQCHTLEIVVARSLHPF